MSTAAIGAATRMPTRERVLRTLVVAGLLVLLLSARLLLAGDRSTPSAFPSYLQVRQVSPQVWVGAAPSDQDVLAMHESARVGLVADAGGRSLAEQATVQGAGMRYLSIPFAPGQAPSADQLQRLVSALGALPQAAPAAYLHGLGEQDSRATMLGMATALLSEQSAGTVFDDVGPAGWKALSQQQVTALHELALVATATSAQDPALQDNPYRSLFGAAR